MSIIWCPVTDELNPGGLLQWKKLGYTWESCCKFCNAEVSDDDFPIALELLKERAALAYVATGGVYVEGAKSPVDGAIRSPGDAFEAPMLYVATPGIRNYLEYGGHGVLVFDVELDHRFVKRIGFDGFGADGKPLNVKGVCASEHTGRMHVSTLRHLICIDLVTEKVLWQREYEAGCDRMALSPDGSTIYLPSLEADHWKVIDSISGDEIARVSPDSGAHNTVFGSLGTRCYLAGLRSNLLTVADAVAHRTIGTIGPFSDNIRPFTVNGEQTHCYVNVNNLLGFEVGDLNTGKMIHRVEVPGFEQGKVKRHGCPSHGIGLTPNEKEIWVSDGANNRVHIFDNSQMPPKYVESIKLRDQPGWITFSIDGAFAYPSTGEVIDTESKTIVATLKDEAGREVHSEKMLQIIVAGNQPMRAGDQFGIGRKLQK